MLGVARSRSVRARLAPTLPTRLPMARSTLRILGARAQPKHCGQAPRAGGRRIARRDRVNVLPWKKAKTSTTVSSPLLKSSVPGIILHRLVAEQNCGSVLQGCAASTARRWISYRKVGLEKQDNCAVCGTKDNLEVHHITPQRRDPSRKDDPSNLITLCDKHHRNNTHSIAHGHGNTMSANPFVRSDAVWLRSLKDDHGYSPDDQDKVIAGCSGVNIPLNACYQERPSRPSANSCKANSAAARHTLPFEDLTGNAGTSTYRLLDTSRHQYGPAETWLKTFGGIGTARAHNLSNSGFSNAPELIASGEKWKACITGPGRNGDVLRIDPQIKGRRQKFEEVMEELPQMGLELRLLFAQSSSTFLETPEGTPCVGTF